MIKKIKKHKEEFELGIIGAVVSLSLLAFLRYLVAPLIRKIWIKDVEGLEHIPKKGPVIIASNHESYFDFICFWAISPRRVQYLAAEKFYKSKFWKPIMIATGQIKVERQKKDKKGVHKQAHYILKNEGMLGIFPEGTRSRSGEIGKTYTGVMKFALEAKVPIVPVGMVGTYNILPPHKKMPKLRRCKVIIKEPIYHHEHFNKEHTEELLRKLTDDLMLLIAGLIGKEYKHHYALAGGSETKKIIEGEIIKEKK